MAAARWKTWGINSAARWPMMSCWCPRWPWSACGPMRAAERAASGYSSLPSKSVSHIHTQTLTAVIYWYIYIYICVCVCVHCVNLMKKNIWVNDKRTKFSASLLQSSVLHYLSEIILICWFCVIINVENSFCYLIFLWKLLYIFQDKIESSKELQLFVCNILNICIISFDQELWLGSLKKIHKKKIS